MSKASAAASGDAEPKKKKEEEEEEKKQDEDPFAPPPMDPLLRLLRQRFAFTSDHATAEERAAAQKSIEDTVVEHNMAPYATLISDAVPLNISPQKLQQMDATNAEKLAKLEATIVDLKANASGTEIREAILEKALHFARIGDINNAVKALDETLEATLAVGQKLDLCFHKVRLGLAVGDNSIAQAAIDEAKKKAKDGDWERKNRLKAYEGLHNVMTRNFSEASALMIECLSTFAATELLDMDEYVMITALVSLVALPRAELKEHIVDSPDVIAADVGDVRALINGLHQCQYNKVLSCLYIVCQQMRKSVFLSPHVNFFFREVRIRAFTQFLDSYRSVTLQSMSQSFNITPQILDQMLFTFISSGRLSCKIDRVSGNVVTTKGDHICSEYPNIVRNGDLLLHKLQKLSRIIEFD